MPHLIRQTGRTFDGGCHAFRFSWVACRPSHRAPEILPWAGFYEGAACRVWPCHTQQGSQPPAPGRVAALCLRKWHGRFKDAEVLECACAGSAGCAGGSWQAPVIDRARARARARVCVCRGGGATLPVFDRVYNRKLPYFPHWLFLNMCLEQARAPHLVRLAAGRHSSSSSSRCLPPTHCPGPIRVALLSLALAW